MRILVVGSGGREHALCWKIAASPLCDKLFCAPGNAGIAAEAECVAIGAEDIEALVGFAKQEAIDFVVVGPEGPLVKGLADRLEAEGIARATAARVRGRPGLFAFADCWSNIRLGVFLVRNRFLPFWRVVRRTGKLCHAPT